MCNLLSAQDEDLRQIIVNCNYPPFWSREPSFETLIHFILEQQVSLASAKAALEKLRSLLGIISPAAVLSLSDEQLKSCYFSRQKIQYARSLADAIQNKSLCLSQLITQPSDIIRGELKKIKGIGDWTADVFLLMSLHHCDIFPVGDLALVNSLKHVKNLPAATNKETLLKVAEQWRPYRSIATCLLWHAYLNRK